jgi:hypothetical protein
MKNFNINTDFKELPEDKILKHRNFEGFLQKAAGVKTPFYKSSLFILGSSGIAIVASVIILYFTVFNQNQTESVFEENAEIIENIDQKLFINPPVDSLAQKFREFTFDPEQDQTFETETGTRIFIPANTFQNNNGNKATGLATLKFREFHTPIDFFLSGIPMSYDSAGMEQLFESSGMFELRAFQNDEELQITEGNKIDLEFASFNNIQNTNFYFLDEEKENWEFQETIKLKTVEQIDKKSKNENSDLLTNNKVSNYYIDIPRNNELTQKDIGTFTKNVEYIEPKLLTSKKYVFEIDFDKNKFPELATYDNILFEAKDKESFNPTLFDYYWEKLVLTRKGKNEYILNLQAADSNIFLEVIPVFDEKDFTKAKEIYESHEKSKKKLLDEETDNFQVYETSESNLTTSFSLSDQIAAYNNLAPVGSYTVSIGRSGIFNCDRPLYYPKQGKDYFLVFQNKGNEKIKAISVFYTDLSRNVLYTSQSAEEVRIDRNNTNVLWAITAEGNIVIIDQITLAESLDPKLEKVSFVVEEMDMIEGLNKLNQILKS